MITAAIYDDEAFFKNYIELRRRQNCYNNLIEQPNLLKMIGSIKGKSVLDVGCGFGALTIALSKLGPKRIIGIDNSERMLEMAMKINVAENVEYRKLDAESIDTVNEKFDVVCSSLTFHYVDDFSSLTKNIYNLLNRRGQLIFSQEHPILTAGEMGVRVSNLSEGIEIKNYSRDGERRVMWLGKEIIKYHRKFSTIVNTLEENGFKIIEIAEPVPSLDLIDENKEMLTELQRPSYLMVKACKE